MTGLRRVVVIGAGIMGAACARALAQDGHQVTVLERGAVAGQTSSHCEGNLLVSDKGPGMELELAKAARARWPQVAAELAAELGEPLGDIEFEPKGGLVVATTEAGGAALTGFAAEQRGAGIDAEALDVASTRRLEPYLRPDCTAAVWYPQDAQLQPTIAAEALLASARLAGASVHIGTEVLGPVLDSGGALTGVLTPGGTFPADLVVNAAGPWSGDVARRMGVPLPVLPRRGMVLVTSRMPQKVFHKVYDGDYFGTTQSADSGLQTSTVVESTPAGTVLIGSSRQRIGFTESFEVDVLAELARKAIELFPVLAGMSLLRSYGGFRPYLPDHLPVIGLDPRLPGLAHVTGHEGAGIGLSVISAELLADQVAGRAPAIGTDAFQVTRPSLSEHLNGEPR
ncbi:FAD-dependent oxidoreductase [Brooklawnia cerclae]|uniref:Glycine/D-amino acid oxidase-like deaminating enzyme n=1 Tax=Brooklawnia cerclae TaxID=349934 RepID=A0ABX0SLF2_9ACTN|nr:FAD-dependent oxidoreductase [Brooklawnia cerclae]NIH58831.1 glycine/D-amino acid oxidase-like deaminating enzyme [Brooklawnia cerclae]